MGNLQKMIDLNRVRTDIPIDVTQLCNTKLVTVTPSRTEGGIMLEDDVSCTVLVLNVDP